MQAEVLGTAVGQRRPSRLLLQFPQRALAVVEVVLAEVVVVLVVLVVVVVMAVVVAVAV